MAPPTVSFSDIKDTKLTVNWNTNGNPSGTVYKVERRVAGTTTFSTVMNYANVTSFIDTGLTPETCYEYRVTARGYLDSYFPGGKPYNDAVSSIYTVITTADPAVAAAQEAASAARAAKESAELAKTSADNASEKANLAYAMAQQAKDNTWDAEESKSAAQLAKEARDKANQALMNSRVPVIRKLEGLHGASCTNNDFFVAVVSTDYEDVTFEATCEGPVTPTITIVGDRITLSNLTTPGAYTLKVTASLGNSKSSSRMTFFRIY